LGVPPEEIRRRVDDALRAVDMYDYREHAPDKLSGGQKQRVAIAGILAMQPDCIVLDEPTAMLDPKGRREVLDTIHRLNRERGMTVVLITHYMDEAAGADRVVVMDEGRILMDAAPRQVFARVEELRLRWGRPMTAVLPEGECPLGGEPVTGQELEQLLELASRASFHTVADQLRRGYLTIEGGHRVGLCGTAVVRDGELRGLRRLSSASVRVARQAVGAARPVSDRLVRREGTLYSTLILAPPGAGKTTLLRDLIRAASDGDGMAPQRVTSGGRWPPCGTGGPSWR